MIDVEQYEREGYLILEDVFSVEEVEAIREEMRQICAGRRGSIDGIEPLDPVAEVTDDIIARYLRIGFPYKVSRVMLEYLRHPGVVDVLTQLIGPNVKCMQSMVFTKHTGRPGQPWHQDEYYIPTRDRSLCGVWVALDDATVDNGGLWIIPGSHKPGILWPMVEHDNPEWNESLTVRDTPFDLERDAVAAEVKAGGGVFFNGYTLHMSLSNKAPERFRRAMVSHYMSAESLLPWGWEGMFELTEDMRDIVMVAGEDPYAWKGAADLLRPLLRQI